MSIQKNPLLLIEALGLLRSANWKLTLIGDGPLLPEARARIQALGLAERVHCTGWLEAPAVATVLHSAEVLVMPSLSEGLPVAAIEGLKHGLAIVSTEIPGTLDVVEDGVNGCRTPLGDVPAFAAALERLIEDAPTLERMRRASWDKVKAFELSAITDQYEAVLRAAANRPTP